ALRERGACEGTELEVDRIINCTGPGMDARQGADALMERLLAAGEVRPGPLGLGLDCDEAGRVVNGAGVASERLSLLGPARAGGDRSGAGGGVGGDEGGAGAGGAGGGAGGGAAGAGAAGGPDAGCGGAGGGGGGGQRGAGRLTRGGRRIRSGDVFRNRRCSPA